MAAFISGIKNAVVGPPPQQQQQQQQQQQYPPQQQQQPQRYAQPNHPLPYAATAFMGVAQPPRWTTRLGQCDPPATCENWMMAIFCFHCAQAQAKSNTDGTNVCYNFMCWHHGGSFSFVRREYGLFGTCGDDLMCSLFCPCCIIRQMLTESQIKGVVPSAFFDRRSLGNREWSTTLFACSCCEFFEVLFCPFCVAHYTRNMLQPVERGDCCFDMLCVIPFSMYGQVRHHHGIRGECGCLEDVCLPVVCYPCALAQARREALINFQRTLVHQAAQAIFRGGNNGRGGCCCC